MNKTVLVIDNDKALVELEAFYFSEQGYTVYTAFDGDVGLQRALDLKPAAIVCDLIMEKMHGFEVLRTLRENPDLLIRQLGLNPLIERHLASFGKQEDH